jgi:hypothetical protein
MNEHYYDPTSEIYFMQRGKTGHGGLERAGPDEVNAALARLLIGNALAQLSVLDEDNRGQRWAWCEDGWLVYSYATMSAQQRWVLAHARTVPATSRASRSTYRRPVSTAGLGGAPMSTSYEDWVAAGKPCLRQSCGHRHGDHIPSEDMECNKCDCLGFVSFAHPDDSAV